MPKPMYVWSGSAWVSVASEVESLATYATQSYADNATGSKLVVPTSVAVGSGSGSVATQGTVTFSGASSISLNGCFTSTYDHYRILLNLTAGSTNDALRMRLRASGTDTSTSNYYSGFIGINSSTGVTTGDRENGGSAFLAGWSPSNFGSNSYALDIFAPKLTEKTTLAFTGFRLTSATIMQSMAGSHYFNGTTSFDGFTFYPDAGNITGNIRVYGYKAG